MPKPVIAAVNGAASGLGADTALACDFVIASEWASFAWSYVLRGIIPDGGGMYFLPRRVGLAKAKELIFTGRQVKLPEALALGIVDRQASAETLVADAQAWASATKVSALAWRSTMPRARASGSLTWRPVKISSLALARPTRRGRKYMPPPSGMMPRST